MYRIRNVCIVLDQMVMKRKIDMFLWYGIDKNGVRKWEKKYIKLKKFLLKLFKQKFRVFEIGMNK